MFVEKTVTIYDDDEIVIKAEKYSKNEIRITVPQSNCAIFISYNKLREVFRNSVIEIKKCAPTESEPKQSICGAKAHMSDDELLKVLGWRA